MDKIKDKLIEENFLLNEAVEDFKAGRIYFADFLYKVETVAKDFNKVLDYWDDPLKDYGRKDPVKTLRDLDKKSQQAYIVKKSDLPPISQAKKDAWFKDSIRRWSQGFKKQAFNISEPRQEELVILPSAVKGMNKHNLTTEDIEDAFRRGEISKSDPEVIIRKYKDRHIFVRVVPDEIKEDVCLAIGCWKVG